MPRVVPSQVVALINQNFPAARSSTRFDVYSGSAGALSAIVRLVGEIRSELLVIGGEGYSWRGTISEKGAERVKNRVCRNQARVVNERPR